MLFTVLPNIWIAFFSSLVKGFAPMMASRVNTELGDESSSGKGSDGQELQLACRYRRCWPRRGHVANQYIWDVIGGTAGAKSAPKRGTAQAKCCGPAVTL